jgi:hypothetical protein
VEDLLVRGWLDTDESHEGRPGPPPRTARRRPKVTLKLFLGDIAEVHEQAGGDGPPVDVIAVGHYFGVKPAGAEAALDRAISEKLPKDPTVTEDEQGLLTQLTLRGTIPGTLGQPYYLLDPRTEDEGGGSPPRLIALAGMGPAGRFGPGEATVLARELCWACARIGRRHLATALIGAGNGNLPAGEAMDAWIRGVAQGLAGAGSEVTLGRISFVEVDGERLERMDEVVTRASEAADGPLELDYTPADKATIKRWRDDASKRAREHLARARRSRGRDSGDDPPTRLTVSREGDRYRYGAITANAAIPERDVPLDPKLVEQANDRLATALNAKRRRDQGLFLGKLLFPADLRPTLSTRAPIVLMVDSGTARIHWELVARPDAPTGGAASDSTSVDGYLGIGPGVTRQLRTTFAPPPEPPPPHDRLLRVLVVADPAEDAHLPGAEEEGIAVADLFERVNQPNHAASVEVVRLFGPRQATREAVLARLMLERFHVLHFAGHCVYDKDDPAASGWIFTGKERLAARELRRIDRIPEFVFSNACESGITPDRAGNRSVELAPSFAEAFFERGVANFVCTAWPVGDEAARHFAEYVYGALLGLPEAGPDGPQPMYKAMRHARSTVASEPSGGRSWGAYQHYGDPLYRLVAPSSP